MNDLPCAAGFRKSLRTRAPAKYHGPSSGKTWSGHDPRPKWLAGKPLDYYPVERAAKPWWLDKDA
ncbi:H-NS family nucleoid-associated regulatory protein [Burkholderia arboris]|nr:H-NS family nucleoid-associated regulatory protein [Burkholderia arboris]UTV58898.1 H-NS family nucleoid-associated regulatory protein [Burkholderia arboris]